MLFSHHKSSNRLQKQKNHNFFLNIFANTDFFLYLCGDLMCVCIHTYKATDAHRTSSMKYSRSLLNRVGVDLYAEGVDAFKRTEAVQIVSEWRMTHMPVLRAFVDELNAFFSKQAVPFAFYSQRIKRMSSIIEKLRNNAASGMRLGGLQDIGGARFVFDSMDDLARGVEALRTFSPSHFTLEKINDYLASPKDSGYRSIHYVYKHSSDQPDYDGLRIELQVRTRLEHSWAMAVETASLISRTSLKANIEDHSIWREFFRLVSAIFARKENCSVNERYRDYSHEQYCRDYIMFLDRHRLLDQLQALRVTVNNDGTFAEGQTGYCIVLINFRDRVVSGRLFSLEQEDAASRMFTRTEQSLNADEAAIMVSIEKMQELREAYPSYFLDTKEFLSALTDFHNSCAIYRQ